MKASKAVKVVDKLLEVISWYASAAAEWEIEEEADFQIFKDELLDTLVEETK